MEREIWEFLQHSHPHNGLHSSRSKKRGPGTGTGTGAKGLNRWTQLSLTWWGLMLYQLQFTSGLITDQGELIDLTSSLHVQIYFLPILLTTENNASPESGVSTERGYRRGLELRLGGKGREEGKDKVATELMVNLQWMHSLSFSSFPQECHCWAMNWQSGRCYMLSGRW